MNYRVIFLACILFSPGFYSDAAIPRGESFPKTGFIKDFFLRKETLEIFPEKLLLFTSPLTPLHNGEGKLLPLLQFGEGGRGDEENSNEKLIIGKNKKWVAVLLAFPLPLGILGAHRIYLGTKPLVPVVYIVTLGGAAGILPLIDFMVLAFTEDITPYQNNPNIIMWMNEVK